MWTIHGPWFMGLVKTSPISNMLKAIFSNKTTKKALHQWC